ncbi:MAG: hypothetical protein AAFU85_17540 [Planctomycetota bacterium]
MATSNRAKLITKLHSELKKKYTLPPSQPSRPLLEHLLYACLLQDAPVDLADEGFAKCEQEFYDWNEVRVTTVSELTQVLSGMPEPAKTARRLKEILQAVFEEFYAFDLDNLKKENLGKAVGKFEAMDPMTPFVLSYTIQHGLGGHSIPLDYAGMVVMLSTGIASQAEAAAGKVPGLERAIPKNKGVEFSALLHEAGVELMLDSKNKTARGLLDAVAKGSSERYDEWEASKKAAIRRVKKRRRDEKAAAAAEAEAAVEAAKQDKSTAKKAMTKPKPPAKAPVEPKAAKPSPKSEPVKKKPVEKAVAPKKAPKKKAAEKTPPPKKTAVKKATKKTTKKADVKKVPSKSTKKKTAKKPAAAKTAKKPAKKSTSQSSAKKSTNRKLSKRKPR